MTPAEPHRREKFPSYEDKVGDLPLLPAVVVRMMGLTLDSDQLFEEVLEIASQDPSLALRVLRMANSAMSAPVSPIETLERAVLRLGAAHVAELVTAAAVTRVFVPRTLGERNLWHHAIEVATASRIMLAARAPRGVDVGAGYLAGLLHDVGRLVMFDQSPAFIQEVDDLAWKTPGELVEAEVSVTGTDHATIGGRVCEHWQVPEEITRAVREHHRDLSETRSPLLAVIKQADFLSVVCHSRSYSEQTTGDDLVLPPGDLEALPDALRFSGDELAGMIPALAEASRRASATLYLRPD